METKKCSKCGEVKKVGEFYKDKNQKDGLRTSCKKCFSKQCKEYRIENPEKIKEKGKKYRIENPEKIKEKNKKYNIENSEKIKERKRKHRLENPEKNKERCKEYRLKNLVFFKEREKKYRIENPERNKKKCKEYGIKITLNLSNPYIKKKLKDSGFTTEQINENPELIEVKRLIIKTKRLCKTLPTSEKA